MQDLYSLLRSLTPNEWSALKIFITAFSPRNPENNKLKKLACLLMDANECPSEKDCIEKVYDQEKSGGFRMLKKRLQDKILDFLSTDVVAERYAATEEMDAVAMRLHKKIIQFNVLQYYKKRSGHARAILDEILRMAEEYEFYNIAAHYFGIKKALYAWSSGNREFQKVSKQMRHFLTCYALQVDAEHYYQELMSMDTYSGKRDVKKKIRFLKKVIQEIGTRNKIVRSARVNYYLKALQYGFYQAKQNHAKAKDTALAWLDIVKSHKSVYRGQRMGIVHDHISECEYYLKRFKSAADYARNAQKYFALSPFNYCISLEQEFFTVFAMRQYGLAGELADKMLTSAERKELGEFRFAKYNFLKACVFFKQKKYKEALAILAQRLEISKDKAGWEIGVRMLRVMCFIELEELKQASIEIERLRKFSAYNKKAISPRDITIMEILLFLRGAKFDFDKPDKKIAARLKLLQGKKKDYRWEPYTHEVIPFHEWFLRKAEAKAEAEAVC